MLSIEPIGTIRTAAPRAAAAPQPSASPAGEGVAVVDPAYGAGLAGLDGFSHVWLVSWLGGPEHRPQDVPLRQTPNARPEGPPVGVFAIRSPVRPVPIGISLVEVVDVTGDEVRFRGVDLFDGTPLLDIKPYFTDADEPRTEVRSGWSDEA